MSNKYYWTTIMEIYPKILGDDGCDKLFKILETLHDWDVNVSCYALDDCKDTSIRPFAIVLIPENKSAEYLLFHNLPELVGDSKFNPEGVKVRYSFKKNEVAL